MAVLRLSLLLQVGFVIGSNHKYAESSDNEKDIVAPQPIYNSRVHQRQQQQPGHLRASHDSPKGSKERTVLPQKIEENLPRVVTAFLHTGNSSTLRHANCSRRYELINTSSRGRGSHNSAMHGALDTVAHAANFLNTVLQANRSRGEEVNLRRDIEWYHALVRSILEGDPKIHRAVVTFNMEPSADAGASAFLQATRAPGGRIVLQDLSGTEGVHHRLKNRTADTAWYHDVKDRKKHYFHKRLSNQESFIPDKSHIKWSAPYLECENGDFNPRWLLTLSAGFYGIKPDLAPDFRGVVRVDVVLQDMDIDQCSADGWFAGTHRCNLTTMDCVPIRGHGFVLDKYNCHCKEGFYHPSRVAVNGFRKTGRKGQVPDGPAGEEGQSADCQPCREGCSYCKDDAPCVAREDGALRLAVLCFQALCMLLVFISMVVVYHFRRNKSIRASGLVLLEAILCGALLLYFPVVILFFQPSVFRCILLRWVRLLGFATVYGTVTLKLYRVLKVFLSRTAQRIPYMTSWRVLRLLGIILLIVVWFLVAWTSAVCQDLEHRTPALIDVGHTPDRLQFSMCLLDRWDYMMAVAEFLFLLWAVYLCFAVRTVPSAFHEPRYMAIAVHNELILSSIFHVIRFTLAPELHPDWMLLLFVTHTHLTVTVTLGLLLVPKFLFAGTQMRDDMASEAYEDELDMGRSGSYLNSSITSAWSEHSLDPEDIRTPDEMGHHSSINGCGVRSSDSLWEKRTNEELKKLYSQLEIYKRKKMLANNPHLQKKRSSKKGLGRSLMRRITEIPESVSRGQDHHGGANRNSICGALRKNPFDPAHAAGKPAKEESSLKNKVFSLKKSHSSYDHVRDQTEDSANSAATTDKTDVSAATTEGSLLETLMGKKLVKKKSDEKMDSSSASESTESVPLVCKSASAHNLTADKKPIHPRTSMLQKSLSVIASAKEKTLGLTTAKTPSAEDGGSGGNKKGPQKSKQETKTSAEESDDECHPKMILSQSVEYKQTAAKGGIMKQQASASQPSVCPEAAKGGKDLYDVSEVCPWEVEDLPTPSENKVQKHVSIAPEETTTIHGSGGTKGGKSQPSKQKGPTTDQPPSGAQQSRDAHKTVDKADVCPWEEVGEGQAQTDGSKQPPSSQVTARSTDGSKQPPSSQVTARSNQPAPAAAAEGSKVVCPWDFEEAVSKKEDLAPPPDKSRQRKGSTPLEGKGKSLPAEPPKSTGGSLQPPPAKADICPWDYDAPAAVSPSFEKVASPQTRVSKTNVTPSSTRTVEKDKMKDPRDGEKSRPRANSKSKSAAEKHASPSTMAQVCPWDVESSQEAPPVEKRRSTNVGAAKGKPAEVVCPWDYEEGAADKKGTEQSSSKSKQASPKAGAVSSARRADVCPWDADDGTSGKSA